MKMKNWTLRLSTRASDKYDVRLNRLKLELGLFGARVRGNETMVVDITAKPISSNSSSSPFALPFRGSSKRRAVFTTDRRSLRKASSLSWHARDLRDFHVVVSDAACDIAFLVLYEEGSEGKVKAKMAVAGKVSMKLTVAELLVTESNSQIHRKLPINLRVNGLCIEATLSVYVSFVKLSSPHDPPKASTNSVVSARELDDSPVFDSDDSSGHSIYKPQRSNPNRSLKGLNLQGSTKKSHTSTTPFLQKSSDEKWQVKEFTSRDGESKLNTNVYFASFDQRSEKASGESACAVLVTLIAHWLHSNQDMPTRPEFDGLITEGSFEWRRLCDTDSAHLKLFPDKHFDLETVIEANLRPLVVVPEKSYTGFFSPEKFQCLKEAMSFDEIWGEISKDVVDCEPRIYIVSWNDHFFVLKVEADAYYIIDSLGERLFEGCKEAFILKFDDSSFLYEKVEKASKTSTSEKEKLKLVCSGKECCKEFIKRFLAALPLKHLVEEEKKGSIFNPYLHRLLQVDFHYSFSLSSSFSSATSSLFSSGTLEDEIV